MKVETSSKNNDKNRKKRKKLDNHVLEECLITEFLMTKFLIAGFNNIINNRVQIINKIIITENIMFHCHNHIKFLVFPSHLNINLETYTGQQTLACPTGSLACSTRTMV